MIHNIKKKPDCIRNNTILNTKEVVGSLSVTAEYCVLISVLRVISSQLTDYDMNQEGRKLFPSSCSYREKCKNVYVTLVFKRDIHMQLIRY